MVFDQDEDLRDFLKKIGYVIFGLIFFIGLLILLYNKRFNLEESKIEKTIKKEEIVFIIYRKSDCSNCKEIASILKKKQVYYIDMNRDRNKNWDKIQEKIELKMNYLENPTLICVKDGKAYSFTTEFESEEEIEKFIETSISNP